MKTRVIGLLILAALIIASPVFAQQGGRGGRGGNAYNPTGPFDPHDLSGFWQAHGSPPHSARADARAFSELRA